MNNETIKLDKNTYAVINEFGNTKIVSTINSNSQETMKNILLKENNIEDIENKLIKYKNALKSIESDIMLENIVNIIVLILLITILLIFWPQNPTQLMSLSLIGVATYAISKTISCGMTYSPRINRKKQKKGIEEEISNLEKLLETATKELEKIKKETQFTELTNINDNTTDNINCNYIYKYNPNNCNLENIPSEEINKEINVMKLSRIKRNPFQKNNL